MDNPKNWLAKRKEAKKRRLMDDYMKRTVELEDVRRKYKDTKDEFDAKADLKRKREEMARLKKEARQMKYDKYIKAGKSMHKTLKLPKHRKWMKWLVLIIFILILILVFKYIISPAELFAKP